MCTIAGEGRAVDGKVCCLPRELQYQYERGKISCRRLEWEGGAVSSRVALLLRSAEAQPYLPRFVWFFQTFFSFFWCWWMLDRQIAQRGLQRRERGFTWMKFRKKSKSPKAARGQARLFGRGVSLWRRGQLGLFRLFDFFQRGQPSRRRDFLTFRKSPSLSQPLGLDPPSLPRRRGRLFFFFLTFHFC